jgi:hypothetical protein
MSIVHVHIISRQLLPVQSQSPVQGLALQMPFDEQRSAWPPHGYRGPVYWWWYRMNKPSVQKARTASCYSTARIIRTTIVIWGERRSTNVKCRFGVTLLAIHSLGLLHTTVERRLDFARERLVRSQSMLADFLIDMVDVTEEAVRDSSLLVQVDGPLKDLITEKVALGEVLSSNYIVRVGRISIAY